MKNKQNCFSNFFDKFKSIDKKRKRILILTIISIVTLITLVSTSYAMFFVNRSTDNKDLYASGNLIVSFEDSTGEAINLTNAQPVSDSYASTLKPYNFSITNTGTLFASYEVVLTDEAITNSNGLTNTDVKSNIKYKINNNNPKLLTNSKIVTGAIRPGETLKFELRLWIKEDASSSIENTSYSAKIAVTGQAIENTLVSLLLGENNTNVTTIAPTFSTTSTDRGLFVEQGDETKSIDGKPTYYFRGSSSNDTINPTYKMNNYVKFGKYKTTDGGNTIGNDIIWRVVRINEDGSVKLITENPITAGIYWNPNGTADYVNAKDGESDTIKDAVEDWYNKNIGFNSILDSKVIEGDFCNDISGNYEGAYRRYSESTPQLTFICSSEGRIVKEKVGLITTDEIIYSGALIGNSVTNNSSYLNNNTYFWSLTPRNNSTVYSWAKSSAYVGYNNVSTTNIAQARAVINLSAATRVISGDGLSADTAYVIKR